MTKKKSDKKKENKDNKKQTKAPSKPGESEETKKAKKRYLILLGIALAAFIFIWIDTVDDFSDPWYEAINLVMDSSNKVAKPAVKEKLIEEGGDKLRELLQEHPYHARIHFFMGLYYARKMEWDSAIACQKKAIFLGSGGYVNNVEYDAHFELIRALFNKGNAFAKAKQVDSAIVCYDMIMAEVKKARKTKRIVDISKKVVNNITFANIQKGNAYGKEGKHDIAIEYYNKALKYSPKRPDVYNHLGISYINKNDINKAKEMFNKALKLSPNDEVAKKNLINLKNLESK